MNDANFKFSRNALDISAHYPSLLYLEDEQGNPAIEGELVLTDEKGVFVDQYEIRIIPSKTFPYSFPLVFEIGGRIPVNVDWHVFPDGHCCIKSIPEENLLSKNGISLLWFIEEQLKPYFFNQKYRELHGYFLHERSHGNQGNLEFFMDAFKSTNLQLILKGLIFIMRRQEPKQTDFCFCESKVKYRKCHRNAYRQLAAFSNEELELYAKMVFTAVNDTK